VVINNNQVWNLVSIPTRFDRRNLLKSWFLIEDLVLSGFGSRHKHQKKKVVALVFVFVIARRRREYDSNEHDMVMYLEVVISAAKSLQLLDVYVRSSKDSNSYLKSRGSIEDFVSSREMITPQLQGKLWLYDEVPIPNEYLLKFHNAPDAKSLWAAIKSRFRGNDESKKMQRNVLKHQFENFSTASNESLDKAYDRFQKLISQLEVHGAPISKEDINQKFLRSLPPSWNQIALIMRNKPDIDEIDIDDLYNNLRVYEDEMKRSSSSTSTSQNLAFLSSENTSSTNEVSTASGDFGVSTAGGISQIVGDDLEELDLRWQVAMLTVRVRKFIQKIGRNMDFKEKQHVSLDKSKIECYNCYRKGHFARECRFGRNQGKRSYGGYDCSNDFEIEPVNYALMAISLQAHQVILTMRARLEIQGYELALESLEYRILVHEKNELAWGEKYEFQNYELKCREIKISNLSLELEKAVKERDEFKSKIEKWEESSKNLDELLNSQMSARDKTGLGYGTQLNEMSNNSETDSEISLSIFYVRSSNEESTPANDRFSKAYMYHAVPPPITRNFLTLRADISFAGLDEYAIRKKIIESKTTKLNANTSKSKTSETVGNTNEVNVEKPNSVNESVMSTPNINKDKVIIEDWNSDDEDDVFEVKTVSLVKTNETQTVNVTSENFRNFKGDISYS
ncbi:ribonuclease H-like domain-containing protein, partial [Tanacetum coccineum]